MHKSDPGKGPLTGLWKATILACFYVTFLLTLRGASAAERASRGHRLVRSPPVWGGCGGGSSLGLVASTCEAWTVSGSLALLTGHGGSGGHHPTWWVVDVPLNAHSSFEAFTVRLEGHVPLARRMRSGVDKFGPNGLWREIGASIRMRFLRDDPKPGDNPPKQVLVTGVFAVGAGARGNPAQGLVIPHLLSLPKRLGQSGKFITPQTISFASRENNTGTASWLVDYDDADFAVHFYKVFDQTLGDPGSIESCPYIWSSISVAPADTTAQRSRELCTGSGAGSSTADAREIGHLRPRRPRSPKDLTLDTSRHRLQIDEGDSVAHFQKGSWSQEVFLRSDSHFYVTAAFRHIQRLGMLDVALEKCLRAGGASGRGRCHQRQLVARGHRTAEFQIQRYGQAGPTPGQIDHFDSEIGVFAALEANVSYVLSLRGSSVFVGPQATGGGCFPYGWFIRLHALKYLKPLSRSSRVGLAVFPRSFFHVRAVNSFALKVIYAAGAAVSHVAPGGSGQNFLPKLLLCPSGSRQTVCPGDGHVSATSGAILGQYVAAPDYHRGQKVANLSIRTTRIRFSLPITLLCLQLRKTEREKRTVGGSSLKGADTRAAGQEDDLKLSYTLFSSDKNGFRLMGLHVYVFDCPRVLSHAHLTLERHNGYTQVQEQLQQRSVGQFGEGDGSLRTFVGATIAVGITAFFALCAVIPPPTYFCPRHSRNGGRDLRRWASSRDKYGGGSYTGIGGEREAEDAEALLPSK